MAASPSERAIRARLRRLAKKYPGVTFQVLRASNGEVAIMPLADVSVYDDGGSVVLLRAVTPRAKDWLTSNLPADGPMMGTWHAVVRRYVGDIVDGIKAEGLTLRLA